MKWIIAVAAFAALALSSCTAPETAPDAGAIVAARNTEFMQAFASGDGTAVAAMYTADAVVMPPGAGPVEGREAIAQFWQGVLESGVESAELSLGETVYAGSGVIVERSTFRMMGGAGAQIDHGKYVVVWRLVDGQWMMAWDIWNSSAAPISAAPTE